MGKKTHNIKLTLLTTGSVQFRNIKYIHTVTQPAAQNSDDIPNWNSIPVKDPSPHRPRQPPFSCVSVTVAPLGILDKRDHTVFVILRLPYLTFCSVLRFIHAIACVRISLLFKVV